MAKEYGIDGKAMNTPKDRKANEDAYRARAKGADDQADANSTGTRAKQLNKAYGKESMANEVQGLRREAYNDRSRANSIMRGDVDGTGVSKPSNPDNEYKYYTDASKDARKRAGINDH
jgi:hypothetical protein